MTLNDPCAEMYRRIQTARETQCRAALASDTCAGCGAMFARKDGAKQRNVWWQCEECIDKSLRAAPLCQYTRTYRADGSEGPRVPVREPLPHLWWLRGAGK